MAKVAKKRERIFITHLNSIDRRKKNPSKTYHHVFSCQYKSKMKTPHLLWYVLHLLWDSSEFINSPLYSTTKSPFLKWALANTPRPSAHTDTITLLQPLHLVYYYLLSLNAAYTGAITSILTWNYIIDKRLQ